MADQFLNRRRLRLGYQAPADSARRDAMKDADRRLVQRIAQLLEFHHPGHFFQVEVDHAQRLVKMNLPPLMESPVWHTIPISVLSCDPGLRTVMRAAGEILERFQMPRSRWDTDQYRAAVRAQPFAANRKKSYRVPV